MTCLYVNAQGKEEQVRIEVWWLGSPFFFFFPRKFQGGFNSGDVEDDLVILRGWGCRRRDDDDTVTVRTVVDVSGRRRTPAVFRKKVAQRKTTN